MRTSDGNSLIAEESIVSIYLIRVKFKIWLHVSNLLTSYFKSSIQHVDVSKFIKK
jgi:hypothetical protein